MEETKIETKDQVVAFADGFYAFVKGHLYGPWIYREYAHAGLQTEVRRAENRAELVDRTRD